MEMTTGATSNELSIADLEKEHRKRIKSPGNGVAAPPGLEERRRGVPTNAA